MDKEFENFVKTVVEEIGWTFLEYQEGGGDIENVNNIAESLLKPYYEKAKAYDKMISDQQN